MKSWPPATGGTGILSRGLFFAGTAGARLVVLDPLPLNLLVVGGLFAFFLVVGTAVFVRGERNR